MGSTARGQDAQPTPLSEVAFVQELERLAAICDRLELVELAEKTRGWHPAQRPDQLLLFTDVPFWDETSDNVAQASWAKRFNSARRGYAAWLVQQAKADAADGREMESYRLLWRALREAPDNVDAKRIVGALARGRAVRPRLTRSRVAHPLFGWPAGSYSQLQTPHFEMTTRAGVKESIQLAQELENVYALWTQYFYPLWAAPGTLTSMLNKEARAWPVQREIQVVLLENRQDYLETLGVSDGNVSVSVGYYNPEAGLSFFYPSDGALETLHHELTHQLLVEATHIGADAKAGTASGIWLVEGIALYMESLRYRENHWTLGGIDSPRMQTARYRGLRDGYWPKWDSFSQAAASDWQSDRSVARLYSHAAGLTHVLLDALGDEGREAVFRALVSLYQGEEQSADLLEQFAGDEDAAKLRYQTLLVVDDAGVERLVRDAPLLKELVLSGSQFEPSTWQSLAAFKQLQWLNLAYTNASDRDLSWLDNFRQLERLSLEGTSITRKTLALIATLPALSELDLSDCQLDAEALGPLRGNPRVRTLWLTNAPLTDQAVGILASLPNLEFVDVAGTQITDEKWQGLLALRPGLKGNGP